MESKKQKAVGRAELVQNIAERAGCTKKMADDMLMHTIGVIMSAVKDGHRVSLRNFGTFLMRHRAARMGRNPKTGAIVEVPPRDVLYFKASSKAI